MSIVNVNQQLSALYEVTQSVGVSLNMRANAEHFFRSMMTRFHVGAAHLWLIRERKAHDHPQLVTYLSLPRSDMRSRTLEHDHPLLVELGRRQDQFTCHSTDPAWFELLGARPDQPGWMLNCHYPQWGLLQLYFEDPQPWPIETTTAMLRGLLNRFGNSVQSCLGHLQLRREMRRRTETQNQLLRMKTIAEEANQAKTDFLASISHELRTPMTAIISYGRMLQGATGLRAAERQWAQSLVRNSEHMLSLVNDVLDISRIEAQRVELHHESFRLPELLNGILELVRPQAESKGLDLSFELNGDVTLAYLSDPVRIKQVLLNLVGNAVKFTDKGGVFVHLTVIRDATSDQARLYFQVIDTGPGILPELQRKIFQPFRQAHTERASHKPGTGLGLFISRKLVELLRGTLDLHSEPGKGSTFLLELPLTQDTAAPTQAEHRSHTLQGQPPGLDGLHVLVADDSLDNQLILRHYLEEAGARVETCENGRLALDELDRALGTGQGYQVVLMDVRMPVLDGLAAMREIRAKGIAVAIIALTANAFVSDKQACSEAGADDFVSKPFHEDELLARVRHWASQGGWHQAERRQNLLRPSSDSLPKSEQDKHSHPRFQAILRIYLEELQHKREALQQGLEQQDVSQIAVILHKVKGTGTVYGFPRLTELAGRSEAALAEKGLQEETVGLLHQLLAEMDKALQPPDAR